jgi:hypothetical protein
MQYISQIKGPRLKLKLGGWLGIMALMFSLGLAAVPAQAASNIALTNSRILVGTPPVVSGIGFRGGEKISLWLTAPDTSVRFYGSTSADNAGNFTGYSYTATANLTDQLGFWYITAQGLAGTGPAIASFTVTDSSNSPPPVTAPNPPPVVSPAPPVTPPPPVEQIPGAAQINLAANILRLDQVPVINGINFQPNERVDLWLTAPDNSVKTYGFTYTDRAGNINGYSYTPPAAKTDSPSVRNARATGQTGLWYITAHGNSGDSTGINNFVVIGPTLAASIISADGNVVTLTYSGGNFFAAENVSLWLTDANGNVTTLGTSYATGAGVIPSLRDTAGNLITGVKFLDNGTTPPYQLTAHGQTSNITVQTPVTPLGG